MLPLDDRKLEFVGARKESYRKDSRKPHVEIGTLEEDLSRRDFTVNAMAASINEKNFGEIADPFNCENDLREKVLRTPLDPEVTFDDDPLRIMRAMRFASQLGFTIEPNVMKAAARMVERLTIVSQERISEEFLKIMSSPQPSIGLQLMYDPGLCRLFFRKLSSWQAWTGGRIIVTKMFSSTHCRLWTKSPRHRTISGCG